MITWKKPLSWSKFKLALDCPKALEFVLSQTPPSEVRPTYWMALGIEVQYIFEAYFNQGVYLRNQNPDVIQKIVERSLATDRIERMEVTYPYGQGIDKLQQRIREDSATGFTAVQKAGLLDGTMVKSEQKFRSKFKGLRVFAWADFLKYTGKNTVEIWDGKNNKDKNADPRQLLWYAMVIMSTGMNVSGGGFIYYKHGEAVPVDLGVNAVMNFIRTDFQRGRKVFDDLQEGVTALPAQPDKKICRRCDWKRSCKASVFYQPPPDLSSSTVGWKEDVEV